MTVRTLTVRFGTAALVLAALAGHAAGQNALGNGTEMGNRFNGDRAKYGLGDGRGLDTNTMQGGSGRNNQVRDFQAELRFRNAIVTGNAPNGLSFRGDLPYFAPGDFHGQTGSNDLYSFRRDSLYSGLAGMGIRGTEALQQQFALTTGNALPELLTGSLTVNRFGSGDPDFAKKIKNSLAPPGLAPGGDPSIIGHVDPMDVEQDFSGLTLGDQQELGTLRSTSAYTSTRGIQPTLLDVRATPNQDLIGVSASTLRGIQSIPLGKSTQDNSLAGAKNALAAGSTALSNPGRQGAGPAPGPITSPVPKTEAAIGSAAYNELLDRLTNYAGTSSPDGTDTRPEWQKQLDNLRQELNNSDLGSTGQGPQSPDFTGLGAGADATAGAAPDAAPGAEAPFTPTAIAPLPPVKDYRFDPAMIGALRNASGQINSLVPLTDTSSGAYADHMQIGQSELAKGRYFDAEEEFTRAIASSPNDAMALVGRIHAQLGAGTNLSAWMNLRELFKRHPEMLGARYGADILPDPERLQEIIQTLRTLIDKGGPLHREASMLLAYVGFQSGDAKALEDGLAAMEKAKEGQADALTDLMAAVWSGREPAPAAPAPGEAPAGDATPAEPQK